MFLYSQLLLVSCSSCYSLIILCQASALNYSEESHGKYCIHSTYERVVAVPICNNLFLLNISFFLYRYDGKIETVHVRSAYPIFISAFL